MPPPSNPGPAEAREARIAEIAARLTAAGLRPQRKENRGHTSVEAAVPPSLSAESWAEVLAALETADWFGLTDSSKRGRWLWAAVRRSPLVPPDPDEGPHVQP